MKKTITSTRTVITKGDQRSENEREFTEWTVDGTRGDLKVRCGPGDVAVIVGSADERSTVVSKDEFRSLCASFLATDDEDTNDG